MRTSDAWAAGLFDGEGCVCIERLRPQRKSGERSVKFRLRIRVNMTCLGAVLRLKKIMSQGWVNSRDRSDGGKRIHVWSCDGERSVGVLKRMLPFLVVKSREAKLALKFMEFQRKSVPESAGQKGASYSVLKKRQAFYEKMLSLKTSKKKSFKAQSLLSFEQLMGVRRNGWKATPWTPQMIAKARQTKESKIAPAKFKSPTGTVYETRNLSSFARTHQLCVQSLWHLRAGSFLQHKGWTLCDP